ncbi:MAG TPA: nucleoside triphosphate pyrophosphohydrolase family protein [Flavisolibacter sp.]|nr:nucleoside triphosphate pyrophosphohydrolase family protein [Flavisolibacter sp.]
MELNEYQIKAAETDLNPNTREGLLISLLGISGEAGELLSIYKKHLRDGDAFTNFNNSLIEELGDILWYLTSTATKYGLSLEQIAQENIKKTHHRWVEQPKENTIAKSYDEQFPQTQQLPRQITFCIKEKEAGSFPTVVTYSNEIQIGDPLTDNAYTDDGYRYHDVFHMSYLAILGWSPVLRKHLSKKRKSSLTTDEVEDGGRAMVIEEGIAALIYSYAKDHNWLQGVKHVDDDLLKAIKKMTGHLEVKNKTEKQWEEAIVQGFNVWRELQAHKEGFVTVDMDNCKLIFQPLSNNER